uniref:Uncharacterized protein n=1 Tax=viral metagenome TaxID=1070528 RepID=A0A6M3L426_9ZZZZ
MRELGVNRILFPDSPEDDWHPITRNHALARRVLAVAKTRIEGKWAAYIDAVPGQNHDREGIRVLESGDKLPERIARLLFSEFEGIPYAH